MALTAAEQALVDEYDRQRAIQRQEAAAESAAREQQYRQRAIETGVDAAVVERTFADIKKPDGTSISNTPPESSLVREGTATLVTGQTDSKAVDKLSNNGTSTIKADPSKLQASGRNVKNAVKNPLHQFASYDVLWTLACLSPTDYNSPTSYRGKLNDLKNVVFSSAGRANANRAKTHYGSPEYYLNNFRITTPIAPGKKQGNTNVFGCEFDIVEPHSMGLLLQSLQVAANNAEHASYLNAPFVLRMDIKGYDEVGVSYETIKPKFFVLKILKSTFKVSEAGSVYHMEAVNYGNIGYSDNVNSIFNDVKLVGGAKGTVEEILKSGPNSLVSIINAIEQKQVKENRIEVADEYDIQFPIDAWSYASAGGKTITGGATMSPGSILKRAVGSSGTPEFSIGQVNEIGQSKFNFDQGTGGNVPFVKATDVVDDKTGVIQRDKLSIDVKNRTFQFAQGQQITRIITEVINCSEYATKVLDPKNMVDGKVKWFKIDVQTEFKEYDSKTGDYAKKIIYRIVPYYINANVFMNPNAIPQGYSKDEERVIKKYEYIYTGANEDILKFDIDINYMFYNGVNSSPENESGKAADPNTQSGTTNPKELTTATGEGSSPAGVTALQGRARPMKDPALLNDARFRAGTGTSNTGIEVAKAFHNAFVNMQADLIKIDLEILGDPYWISDSGMGGYFSESESALSQVTKDGSMNYESGEVLFYITFRTPVDINESTGLYDFPSTGKESPFSGLYRVTKCESVFSDGTFKQRLEANRMPAQASDFIDSGVSLTEVKPEKTQVLATVIGKEEKEKSSPIDDKYNDLEFDP